MPSLEKSPSLGWGENNEAEREEAEPLEQFRSGLLHLQLRQDSVRQLNGQESSQGNTGTTSLVVNAQTSGTFLFPGFLGVVMMTSSTVYGHNVFADFSVGNIPFVGSLSFTENFNLPHFAANAQQGNAVWNSTFSGTRRSGSVPGGSSGTGEFSTEAHRRMLRRCVSVGSEAATAENVSSTRTAVFYPDSSTPEEELGAVGGSDIEMVRGATAFTDNNPPNSELRPIEELQAVGGVQPFPTLPTPRLRRVPAVDFSLWAQSAPVSSPDSQTVQGEHEEEQEDVFDEDIPQFHPLPSLQPRGNRGLRCQGPQRRSSCAF